MNFSVFHQLGHNGVWNIKSLTEDRCGDGLILSPRSMEKTEVEKLSSQIKRISIFDPQFFLPDTAKGKLKTYDFYPDIVCGGFDTEDFTEDHANEIAKRCIDFQIGNEFSRITIPTRYLSGNPTNFIETQEKCFVQPFLRYLSNVATETPVVLQIIINESMLKDSEYLSDIINWITSLQVNGVYLITESSSSSKQVKDSDFLLTLFDLIDALNLNDLEVNLGYLNTESILLSIASPSVVTIGSYENTRAFKRRTFEDNAETKQQGPNPRLYTSKLLQWIEFPYVGAIKRVYPDLSQIFDINKYQAEMFQKTFKWHFSKPQLYKHHFLVIYEQLKEISGYIGADRFRFVKETINKAIRKFEELDERGIILDHNSDGSHLHVWLTVANLYGAKFGWR